MGRVARHVARLHADVVTLFEATSLTLHHHLDRIPVCVTLTRTTTLARWHVVWVSVNGQNDTTVKDAAGITADCIVLDAIGWFTTDGALFFNLELF
jgi:hypothetical protein